MVPVTLTVSMSPRPMDVAASHPEAEPDEPGFRVDGNPDNATDTGAVVAVSPVTGLPPVFFTWTVTQSCWLPRGPTRAAETSSIIMPSLRAQPPSCPPTMLPTSRANETPTITSISTTTVSERAFLARAFLRFKKMVGFLFSLLHLLRSVLRLTWCR